MIATVAASLGEGADVDEWTLSSVCVPFDAWDQEAKPVGALLL